MARRSFNVVDVTEILIHWHAGRSQSEIATSLGVDRKTVKKYLGPAIAAGVAPGDAPRSSEQWAELVRSWWPGLVDMRLRQTTWPQIQAHHQFIVDMLAAGVTQQTIWQRLRHRPHAHRRRQSRPARNPSPTTAYATCSTASPGPTLARLLAKFAGNYSGQGRALMMNLNGSGLISCRTYKWCSDVPTPPCDELQGNNIIDVGQIEQIEPPRRFRRLWTHRGGSHPFIWTKTADEILKKANRPATSEMLH
jgi:hypothetical protein